MARRDLVLRLNAREGNGCHHGCGTALLASDRDPKAQGKMEQSYSAVCIVPAAAGLVLLSLCQNRIRLWQSRIFSLQRAEHRAAPACRSDISDPDMAVGRISASVATHANCGRRNVVVSRPRRGY